MLRSEVSDAAFDAAVGDIVAKYGCDKHFYAKIAGASHPNANGSSRTQAIAHCRPIDLLELRPEPENPFDSNAIAVLRQDGGEQLGYLEARLAEEVSWDLRSDRAAWMVVFRHADHHPETGRVVGAVIYILRLPSDPDESR